MADFCRRLPVNAMNELGKLVSKKNNWWTDLLSQWAPSGSSGELRLAIRNRYMNFYSKGQSVAKIFFDRSGRSPTMRIHEKYVKPSPNGGQRYLNLLGDEGFDADGNPGTWRGPDLLEKWIANSLRHTGKEKRCIDALVEKSATVIDLEMGLPAFDDRKTALRMDLVALEGDSKNICLVFWEAKLIADGRLRSKDHNPKVFEQINNYRSYLRNNARKIRVIKAYRNCCSIIRDLHSMASKAGVAHPLDPLILAASDPSSKIRVDDTPRLVVFDDGRKRREEAWQTHLDVLRQKVTVEVVKIEMPDSGPCELIDRSPIR